MLSKNQLGFLYMFLSVCAFSLMDLVVKWSNGYPLGQVLFFRGFVGALIYFLIIPKERISNFYYTKRPGLHFLRCFFGLIALLSIFTALRNLPLATVVSISFAAPIFTTIFSIFFERKSWNLQMVGCFNWVFRYNYNSRTRFKKSKYILYLPNHILPRNGLCSYFN